MESKELKKKYIEFFKKKGHKNIVNASLIPENDPTVLFTTAGMHPLVPFLLGEKHPQGKRLVNVQKCIRTSDIEEVGDDCHLTFFEMLGNWSLGDYFKEEMVEMSYEFLIDVLKLDKERIGISCFKGDKDAGKDTVSAEKWGALGINKERIAFLPKSENWWESPGETGPCGPDSEMFFYIRKKVPKKFDVEDKNWVEIWNDVFMEYNKNQNGKYEKLKQQNVDTGMGVERTVAILNGYDNVYEIDTLKPLMDKVNKLSKKNDVRSKRIVVDHLRAAVFILNEKVEPGNLEQGYVLRRLIRRAIRHGKLLGINHRFCKDVVDEVFKVSDYKFNKKFILNEIKKEEEKFDRSLNQGMRIFEKESKGLKIVSGKLAFTLFASYGFPLEMTREMAKEKGLKVDEKGFEKAFEEHQKLSRTATAGRFKSGLADSSEMTTKLHTATHLLLQALKEVLHDENIMQKGSNITPERLRLDFNFPRKVERDELDKIEDKVNEQIKKKLEVKFEEMSLEEAKKKGVKGAFEHKYGEKVKVYSIGSYSKELCAGPHVSSLKELGKFKIKKEESSSSGVRRIKAKLL
ncbi:MAG: alanine--tRNA ligase [Nanoarchaeota archaeon]|jgi:alanyl-tRNA synthetase|nr:alanine--tRNA ligase [Nanoarchaeota archaeon]|tara:strand:- start:22543 stop:24264 length:1722 start_codon:yes stop_codon:yes gene_type:complete